MKTFPLLLVACLSAAVVLAGCAGGDTESTGDANGNNQTGREISTDITVAPNETDNSTMETNETNSTGDAGTTSG